MLLSDRGRQRALGANPHLVAQSYVRDEHGEKLDRCDELVIAAQARVKPVALVVDHAVVSVRQSPQRNGRSLDVLEESLERLPVACCYPARRVEIETRVLPAPEKLHTLGGDRVAFEPHLERSLPEELPEGPEVEIPGSGVERALGVEDAKRGDGVEVGVWIEEISEGLRCDDHARYRAFDRGELRGEELACGGIGDLGELAVECAVEEKVFAEHLRDRKNHLQVRDVGQDFGDHALGPCNGASLPATRTEPPCLSGKRQEFLVPTVGATHPEKPEVKIATTEKRLEELPDARVERSVGRKETLVVDLQELLKMIFDDLLEGVRRRTRSVAWTEVRERRVHASGRWRNAT